MNFGDLLSDDPTNASAGGGGGAEGRRAAMESATRRPKSPAMKTPSPRRKASCSARGRARPACARRAATASSTVRTHAPKRRLVLSRKTEPRAKATELATVEAGGRKCQLGQAAWRSSSRSLPRPPARARQNAGEALR